MARMDTTDTIDTTDTTTDNAPSTTSRSHFLRQAGLGAAGLALTGALPAALNPGRAHAALSFANGSLNVSYWTNVVPKKYLQAVFDGFAKQNNVSVKYNALPAVFGDDVQKLTTALSSGYTGYDVLWLDDFMTGTFSTAGWLEPLAVCRRERVFARDSALGGRFEAETRTADAILPFHSTINEVVKLLSDRLLEGTIPSEIQKSVPPATIKLSTYNGHLYRMPGNAGDVIFFYRKDLFDQAGLSVPKTWADIVKAGKALTKGGRYGIGFAGKNGNTELFNEMCYWMGQAGADPLHLKTSGARAALKFVYDMLNTYKIMPPDTVTADYTSLQTAFLDSRFAMWPVWDGFYGAFQADPKMSKPGKLAISVPPRGPVNNTSITASWGWAISKYSKNKDLAAKFIRYATQSTPEELLVKTGSAPARTSVLSIPSVEKTLRQAPYLALYARQNLTHSRPITGQAQRISDAFETVVNQYLNKKISLDDTINQGQQRIDQILQNS